MAENYSSHASTSPRRRLGCLPKLLIWGLVLGLLYWLLFAPLRGTSPSDGDGGQLDSIDGELTSQQQAGYDSLAAQSSELPRVVAEEGAIRFLSANVKIPDSVAASPLDKALYFLEQNETLLQVENIRKNFRMQEIRQDKTGNSYINFTQEYQGVPIYGSSITVGISESGEVNLVNGGYVPNLSINVLPAIRSRDAEKTAVADFDPQNGNVASPTWLAIHSSNVAGAVNSDAPRLVWVVTITSSENPEGGRQTYLVDAMSGSIINKVQDLVEFDGALEVFIFDVNGSPPSTHAEYLAISETETYDYRSDTVSQAAASAYENITLINDYFWSTFERNSYTGDRDGKVVVIIVDAVAYGSDGKQCKAGWIPSGEQIILCRGWSMALDPLAHEYGHAVNSYSAKLPGNEGEGGALNEAFGDLFAVFIDDVDPWHIRGDNSERRDLTASVHFRDQETSCGNDDLGCVHANSVVFSHAAYLMDQNGVPRSKLQYIYYYALTNQINSATNFKTAANIIVDSCDKLTKGRMYTSQPEITSDDCQIVREALISVGLLQGGSSPSSPPPLDLPVNPLESLRNWLNGLQEQLRDLVDQLVGGLRLWIEEQINNIVEYINQKIEEGIDMLINALINMLVDALNRLSMRLCGLPCFGVVIPLGAVMIRLKHGKKYGKTQSN